MTTLSLTSEDLVLGIETSCDETSAAVLRGGREVLSVATATQEHLHEVFGGVVPEVASRRHVEVITLVVADALRQSGHRWEDLNLLAVAHGPGLVGSLLVGVSAAKGYALATGLPLLPVNHLEGHLMSAFLHQPGEEPAAADLYPTLGLIASGGHSDLVLMASPGCYETVGRTRDDAAGEALDKAARHLGLGFPGGPALEKASLGGDPTAIRFPRPRLEGFDYSFSGLKTALLRHVTENSDTPLADVAASFQQAIVDSLCLQLSAAAGHYSVRQIVLGGGVSANRALRTAFLALAEDLGIPGAVPPLSLCTDNAAIIAAAGFARAFREPVPPVDFDVFSVLPLDASS